MFEFEIVRNSVFAFASCQFDFRLKNIIANLKEAIFAVRTFLPVGYRLGYRMPCPLQSFPRHRKYSIR